MWRREDSLSLELYITLAAMSGIIGIVLVAIGVFSDWPLELRALRVLTGLAVLYGCRQTARVALARIRVRRAVTAWRPRAGRQRRGVPGLARARLKIEALRRRGRG